MKSAVLAAWRAHLLGMIEDLSRVSDDARASTRVDGTHRPANRGERGAVTTQGYLTHGLTARLGELKAQLDHLEKVDPGPRNKAVLGALIEVDSGRFYALLPGGQGVTVTADGIEVTVLSVEAPLARALAGLEAGEGFSWRGTELEIVGVR